MRSQECAASFRNARGARARHRADPSRFCFRTCLMNDADSPRSNFIRDLILADKFWGKCNLRFDDTNPTKEEQEYVEAIIEDVKWLGGDFGDRLFYASDYFQQLYDWAVDLIKKGKAFVCDLSSDQVRETRGTLTKAGQNSPYRDRSVEENLDRFARMKDGKFPDGSCTLRAKIDMASPNLNMRDPVMYRILH